MKKQMATKIQYVSPHSRQSNGPMATKHDSKWENVKNHILIVFVMLLVACSATLDTIQL